MAREYFCAYHSYLKSMRNLSDAECGRLFRALLQYSSGERSINLQGRESIAFDFITEQIDRDNAAYAAKCAQNRENRLGGNGQQASTVDIDRQRPSTTVYKEKEKEKEKKISISNREVPQRNERGIYSEGFCAELSPTARAPHVSVEPVGNSVLFLIPLNDGTVFAVTDDMIRHWRELYPAVSVEQEIRGMIGWCEANPKKRKTRNGVMRFITGWLSKSQDKSGGSGFHVNGNGQTGDETRQALEMLHANFEGRGTK